MLVAIEPAIRFFRSLTHTLMQLIRLALEITLFMLAVLGAQHVACDLLNSADTPANVLGLLLAVLTLASGIAYLKWRFNSWSAN